MKLNITPRINADASLVRELRDHANLVNLISDGRLQGTNNATTAAPTTGTHSRGDFVRNTAPADSGATGNKYSIYGWLCVLGGTPGTWVQVRYMTADVATAPGGLTTQVQYNDAGAFAGDSDLTWDKANNLLLLNGTGAALATTATGGFACIPTCAGTPTGVPVGVTAGNVPMIFDTTGVKIWIYTGGAWKGVVVA